MHPTLTAPDAVPSAGRTLRQPMVRPAHSGPPFECPIFSRVDRQRNGSGFFTGSVTGVQGPLQGAVRVTGGLRLRQVNTVGKDKNETARSVSRGGMWGGDAGGLAGTGFP